MLHCILTHAKFLHLGFFLIQFENAITQFNGTGHIQSTRAFYQRVPNKYKRFANPNIFSY